MVDRICEIKKVCYILEWDIQVVTNDHVKNQKIGMLKDLKQELEHLSKIENNYMDAQTKEVSKMGKKKYKKEEHEEDYEEDEDDDDDDDDEY